MSLLIPGAIFGGVLLAIGFFVARNEKKAAKRSFEAAIKRTTEAVQRDPSFGSDANVHGEQPSRGVPLNPQHQAH